MGAGGWECGGQVAAGAGDGGEGLDAARDIEGDALQPGAGESATGGGDAGDESEVAAMKATTQRQAIAKAAMIMSDLLVSTIHARPGVAESVFEGYLDQLYVWEIAAFRWLKENWVEGPINQWVDEALNRLDEKLRARVAFGVYKIPPNP